MPMFSLFSSHVLDAKKDEKKDTSKLDAPVAKKDEPERKKETTINLNGDIIKPATPLDIPSNAEQ
jgi:hypothetical protein